jgi:class 3 adenylate cyclase
MQEKELALSARAAIGELKDDDRQWISARLETLAHAEHMGETEKQHIIRDIERNVRNTGIRILFTRITGRSPKAFFTEVEQDYGGVVNLGMCLQRFNDDLEKALSSGIIGRRELVRVQDMKITIAEIVSDLIALHESIEKEALANAQTDQQRAIVSISTQVDRIRDLNRGIGFHPTLQAIARHVHDTLGTKEIENVGISYVNEGNDHLQSDRLTRISPDRTKDTPGFFTSEEIEASGHFPENIFSGEGTISIHDPARQTHFIGFKLGQQCLGVLDIHFRKPNTRLQPEQEGLCISAISQLDTYLDSMLKPMRARRHRRKVERILDRSGTDIVFEDGQETGFRQGIIRALTYLCNKTGAKLIRLKLDVMGDGKSFPLHLFIGKEGEISPEDFIGRKVGLVEKRHKITVPPGTVNDEDTRAVDNGTISFIGEELDEEDQDILETTAEKLISVVRNWRNDLNNTINYGLPPKVALLRKQGLLQPKSVEDLSMSYTDLRGFTAVSERINEITSKYNLKEDYMMRLIAAYDQMGKEIAEQSGGCFDKLVGDCLVINAGPPYTTDGLDGLGLKEHQPSFHAVNCLKIALRIKHGMPKIQQVYEDLLLEMAREIEEKSRSGAKSGPLINEDLTTAENLDVFCATHNIPRHLSVTQGISSGKATVGLVRDTDTKRYTYSSSYTVIGDEMNIAARFQSNANADEMVIGKRTKELIERAIEQNTPIPFNADGQNQDWESFKAELLGEDYERYDLIPVFEETMLDLKNKQGYEFAYRLAFEKAARAPARLKNKMTEEELRDRPGYYKILNSDSKDRNLEVHVEDTQSGKNKITATIAKPPTETRYVTPEDFDRRVEDNCDTILKIKDGRIIMVEYVPIDRVIDGQLETLHREPRIYETSQIPHGIYAVKKRFTALQDLELPGVRTGRTILEVEMNGIPLLVQVNDEELLELRDIKDRPKAKTLYDIHLYSHQKRKALIQQNLWGFIADSPEPDEILFIHSSGEFFGKPQSLDKIEPTIPPSPTLRSPRIDD